MRTGCGKAEAHLIAISPGATTEKSVGVSDSLSRIVQQTPKDLVMATVPIMISRTNPTEQSVGLQEETMKLTQPASSRLVSLIGIAFFVTPAMTQTGTKPPATYPALEPIRITLDRLQKPGAAALVC
jgi:hypothetical protein